MIPACGGLTRFCTMYGMSACQLVHVCNGRLRTDATTGGAATSVACPAMTADGKGGGVSPEVANAIWYFVHGLVVVVILLAIASTEICTHTPLFASSRRICMPTAMPAAFPIALAHALLRCRPWRSAAPAGHMPGTNDRSGRGAQKHAEYLDWITTLISLTASEKTSPVAG